MRLLVCVFAAFVALAGASTAQAASGALYGIQDDAWLEHGPGTLESRLDELDRLGVDVVRYTVRWDLIAKQRPTDARDHTDLAYDWRIRGLDAAWASETRHPAGHHAVRDPALGERRPRAELGADLADALRGLLARGRDPLSVDSPLDDLERAEQARCGSARRPQSRTSGSS